MRGLHDLPFLVILMGIGALAMLVPALHAAVLGLYPVGRAFLYSGLLLGVLTAMVAIAAATYRPGNAARSHLGALFGAYLVLPPALAVPLHAALGDVSFAAAWFEMVASFTTTGASILDAPQSLPDPVHLWRALVGWLGGAFILISAATILAPLNLGGFEVLAPHRLGQGEGTAAALLRTLASPSDRLWHFTLRLAPVYAGLTGALAVGLVLAGDPAFVAICHAMAVLSTSGISPVGGLQGASAGIMGEALVLLGLALALTRRSLPVAVRVDTERPIWADPELRLAALILGVVALGLFARLWIAAPPTAEPAPAGLVWRALWGSVFMALSFLTTTGFVSAGWDQAQQWSGLNTPGLVFLGLAIMGGGVATTAGGVRLLRIHALYRLGRHEMDLLSHPSLVAGGDKADRRLRSEGAMVAFIFFMLFALGLGAINAALALAGVGFAQGVVLSVAALTNAGPLADVTGIGGFAGLDGPQRSILAAAMIAGRIELLVLLALLVPAAWRK
jgi:trk system potassium uptake protein TrkH